MPLLLPVLLALFCSSCQRGKAFYPVSGHVFADGKSAAGVTVVFHPVDDTDPQPVQPSAVVGADGSFVLRSFLVDKG
jgi:hypothetical protein